MPPGPPAAPRPWVTHQVHDGIALAGSTFSERDGARFPHPVLNGQRFAIAADIRLDNRQLLSETLIGRGAAVNSALLPTDLELLELALERWGEHCCNRLLGDFAFVAWDRREQRLLAARDPLGVRALYAARLPAGWAIATDPEQLLAHPKVSRTLCRSALASFVAGNIDGEFSPFAGIEPITPGSIWSAGPNSVSTRRYWQFDPDRTIRYSNTDDYCEHFREVLTQAVQTRMGSGDGRIASELSGGLDSSAISAVAAQNGALWCAITPHYRTLSDCDESAFARASARRLGVRLKFVDAERVGALSYPAGHIPELIHPWVNRDPALAFEMRCLARDGVTTLLTGLGGDEVIGGNSLAYSERFWSGDVRVLRELFSYWDGEGNAMLGFPRLLYQLLLKPNLAPRVQRYLARALGSARGKSRSWDEIARDGGTYRPGDPRFTSRAKRVAFNGLVYGGVAPSLRTYDYAGARCGIDVGHPFLDRRVVEFAFAVPAGLWNQQLFPKWLLRQTLAKDPPAAVVWRQDKTDFGAAYAHGLARQGLFLDRALRNTRFDQFGLFDREAIRLALKQDRCAAEQPTTFCPLSLQIWLNTHQDAFAI